MYGLLVTALPLADGYSTTLSAVDEDGVTYREVPIRVIRRETIDGGPLGQVETWLTEAKTYMGAMRFWVSKSPPYLIRIEWDARPGIVAQYSMC